MRKVYRNEALHWVFELWYATGRVISILSGMIKI